MPHDVIGCIHLLSAIISLLVGLLIFLGVKGTARHRMLGWCYGLSILVLNLSALLIYRLTAHFNVFHVGAVVSLITTLGGLTVIRSAKPGRLLIHYYWMCASYVGLLAAFFAEVLTRAIVPLFSGNGDKHFGFWMLVVSITALTSLCGVVVINRNAPKRS